MALWTLAEQQMIKPIDTNNQAKFELLQREVESNDLEKYLGFEFYQELLRNTLNYSVLLNGGTYTVSGVTYRFQGLKYVCAYLLYSRYIRQSYIQDTFTGFVAHTADNTQRLSAGEIKQQADLYKEIAGTAWDGCLKYIDTLGLSYYPCSTKRNAKKIDYL
jgi:hypothetical protein